MTCYSQSVVHGRQPAFLGVRSQSIDQAKSDGHEVQADSGAYIVSVETDSPAAKAGIKAQ